MNIILYEVSFLVTTNIFFIVSFVLIYFILFCVASFVFEVSLLNLLVFTIK